VSPSAAIAPLEPSTSTAKSATKTTGRSQLGRVTGADTSSLTAFAPSCVSVHAVSESAARSRNVLSRCRIIESPRFIDLSVATSSNSTRPAPTSASVKMKNVDAIASFRARWPRGSARSVQTMRPTTTIIAIPLVTR